MDELTQEIVRTADEAVASFQERAGGTLDFSEASLQTVEEMLNELAEYGDQMSPKQLRVLAQDFGCYILEIGRREFVGRDSWFEQGDQPVLIVGGPALLIAMVTWEKVLSRLSGEPADNIPFFYAGFAGPARRAEPGVDALYV